MKHDWYLQAMGIDQYDLNTQSDWDELQRQVATCQSCPLHATRTQTVFGVGSKTAEIVFIGEAPGQQEDLQGEPFVGRAGQLLNQMLFAIGLKREDIYITNILKCRPPNNRDPNPEEVKHCMPFLKKQLQLLKPKLIVSLGRISAQYLLESNLSLSRLRNQQHVYKEGQIPLIATYHPAYLLRTPADKAKAWEDFVRIKNFS